MLSFLAPGYLFAALAAAAGLVAAHFIVRRQPRAMVLPTARFVPDTPVITTGWARIPADLAVLALRALCVVLAGLALAQPFFPQKASGVARVILADHSRAVADTSEVRDSVAAVRAPDDVVIAYGSSAVDESIPRPSRPPFVDSQGERGSLSAGLVAAIRAASRFRDRADSVELVVVSSFAAEELDAATHRIRQEWPGRARLIRVAAPAGQIVSRAPALVAEPGDPLAVALAASRTVTPADVRITRAALTAADSSWVRGQPGRVLLHWPIDTAPAGFVARAAPATAGGVATRGNAVVAPFQVRFQHAPALGSTAVAWWMDGDVAAAESVLAQSCIRSVAIPVSAAGDFVLRPDFHAVVRDLLQSCGGAQDFTFASDRPLAMLAGSGGLAPANLFAAPRPASSPIAVWLLIASMLSALLELLVRRRRRARAHADRTASESGSTSRKAA